MDHAATAKKGPDKPDRSDWGPGVVDVRPITSRCYGVRVQRSLVPRLKDVEGIRHANPQSDLFCVEVDGVHNTATEALGRFKEIVREAGLGKHFGVKPARARRA